MTQDAAALLVAREATIAKLSARLCRVAVELSDAEFLRLLHDMTGARAGARTRQPAARANLLD